jgi:hypothetical protein
MNYELKVKEILKQTYILTGKINDEQLIKNLIEIVKKNKDENLSYKTHVKGHFTGFKSLTQNNEFITFLKNIQENIKIIYRDNFIIQDAWGNICKIGEEVTEHNHGGITGFCGILYLTEGGPGTYFKEHDLLVKEEIGRYVLFHPLLKHSVKKIENDIERITIAFNMEETKNWENYSQVTWVNKNEI